MKYVAVQICGMALMVLGAQGAVRQLFDHDDRGLLSWLPGGFPASLTVHIVLALVGVLLAGWGDKARKRGQAA